MIPIPASATAARPSSSAASCSGDGAAKLPRRLAALLISLSVALSAALVPAAGSAQASPPASKPAADGPVRVEAVEAELIARESAIVPGRPVTLGLRLMHDPHWHTYWRNPGDSGLATQLELALPPGFAAGPIEWPAPKRLFIPPLANYGFEDELVLPVTVRVPESVDGSSLRVSATASWLMCREVCIPGEARLSLTIPVVRDGTPPPSRHAALFDAARARMPAAQLEARVSVDGDRMSLGLPEPLQEAEFFPYREGLIGNAEPQPLHAVDAAGQPPRRLEIRLSADGARAIAADPAERLRAAEGVLVAGDRVFELKPVAAASQMPAGVEISRVAGAPAATPGASFGGASGGSSGGLQLPGLAGRAGDAGAGPLGSPGGATAAGGGGPALGATNLLLAALFAAIGGLILNLMPCVFPVIGLKVLGFAQHGGAGEGAHGVAARRASRAGAFAFSSGVVASFWVLAALLLALRAAGQAAGWGFQLQSPVFVAAMALLFVAIALNFSGVWEFGMTMTRLGQLDQASVRRERSPLLGAFGSGALAVLVATPCTAPFMGSALGFTLSATVAETLVVFTALGLGMALPYLLLGLFPAWLRWLPKPGRWMESFRQALAFPMYATAAWLAWVLGQQAGIDAVFALAVGAVLIGLSAWLYGRFVQQAPMARVDPAVARRRRALAGSLAAVALVVGLLVAWPSPDASPPGATALGGPAVGGAAAGAAGSPADAGDPAAWYPWSADAVAQARAGGRPVFVDFTAAWCVSCQVNKKLVLDRDAVVGAMQRAGVLRLKADWTNRDPAITAELARHGRNGVPLYLVYRPGDDRPIVLPELLTNGIVLDALAGLEPRG